MPRDPLWIMIDIETSGPVVGRHSMTELGAAVGSAKRGVIDRFEVLISPISDQVQTSGDSFERATREGLPPQQAMRQFAQWCRPHLDNKATFIARPAAFDWPWIVWYAWTYLGENPFGFRALCASSWFQALGKKFDVQLPHVAVKDAEIQLVHFLELPLGPRSAGPLAGRDPRAPPTTQPAQPDGQTILDPRRGGITCLAFSPDGKRLAGGSYSETVTIWDVAASKVERSFTGHSRSVYCVAFSPDGSLVASGDGEDDEKPGRVLVWAADTANLVRPLGPFGWTVSAVAWSPDGTRVASACYDGFLRVHDVRTGEQLLCANPRQDELRAVAWSPDGQTLATAGGEWNRAQPVKLWNVASGKLLRQLKGHKAQVKSLAYSPDGRLASLSLDGTARTWDPSAARQLHNFRAPPGKPTALAVNNHHLACGLDTTIRVWDVSTAALLRTLEGHRQPVTCLALSPDGKTLASAAGEYHPDGDVRLWSI